MQLHPAWAALAALGGAFLVSLGMTLQKRNVAWIGAPLPLVPRLRRAAFGWFAGFMLVNVAPAFNYAALLGLEPNLVAAAAGASVAFTAWLAAPLLGERVGARRAAWSALLFAGLALAGLRGQAAQAGSSAASAPTASLAALVAALALPALAAGLALLLRPKRRGPRLALLFAAAGGSFGGTMVLSMRAMQLAAGNDIAAWFATPYPYLFLVGGFGGFVFAQYAYKDAEMSSAAPVYYGMQVLWPALASYLVFGAAFDPVQAAAFALVALAIAMIAKA